MTLKQRIEIITRINREWSGKLTPPEFMVAMAIADRTVAWGRRSGKINLREFTEGIKGHRPPLPIGRSRLLEIMKSLEIKGLLLRKQTAFETIYELTEDTIEKGDMANLKISKKAPRIGETPRPENRTTPSGKPDYPRPENRTTLKDSNNGDNNCMDSNTAELRPTYGLSVEKAIQQVEEQAKSRRASSIEKAKQNKHPTPNQLYEVWEQACIDTFPKITTVRWGIRDKGIVRATLSDAKFSHNFNSAHLVDWSIRNWLWVCELEFDWMGKKKGTTSYPDEPSLRFFVRWINQFVEWYNRRKAFEGRREEFLLEHKRTYYVRRGYSEAEADSMANRGKVTLITPKATPAASSRLLRAPPRKVSGGMTRRRTPDRLRPEDLENLDLGELKEYNDDE